MKQKIRWWQWPFLIVAMPLTILILLVFAIWDKDAREIIRDGLFRMGQALYLPPIRGRNKRAKKILQQLLKTHGGTLVGKTAYFEGPWSKKKYVISEDRIQLVDIARLNTVTFEQLTGLEYILAITSHILRDEPHYLSNLCCTPEVQDPKLMVRLKTDAYYTHLHQRTKELAEKP